MTRNSNKSLKNNKAEAGNLFTKNAYLLIIIIPLLVLFPSVKNGFVYFDDDILILENQAKIANPENVLKAFQTDAFFNNSSPYYRPLLNVSFMLDAQVAKTSPGFYHFMNLFYHILCCLSLLWFLQLLGLNKEKSFAGVLAFSVHPIMAGAVFWIPARSDLLVTLFGLLFLSLSITWFRTRKPLVLVAALFTFAGALFSKESGILLPFLLALYLLLTRQFNLDKGKVLYFTGVVFTVVLWFVIRTASISMVGSWQLGAWAVVANFPFPLEIIAKFFLPVNLAVTPVYTPLFTGLGVLFILLIVAVFLKSRKKASWLFYFGCIWYIAFSLPNMFVRLDNAASSYDYLFHRSYFPLAGLLVTLLSIIPDKWTRIDYRPALIGCSCVIIFLGANSVFLESKYKDANSFWESSISYKPDRAWFHYFLGRYYFKQQDYVMFEQHLRKSIALQKHPNFLYQLGLVYFLEKKSYDSAFILFNEARSTGYTDPEANSNYIKLCIESARYFFEKGEYSKAAARCQLAVDLDPTNSIAAYNMGLYLVYSGDAKRAGTLWRRSLSLNPELKEAYRSLYYFYLNNTSNHDSIEYFARELQKRGGSL